MVDPTRQLASEVIFYALVDLIHQSTMMVITSVDYEGAAEFFRSGDYVPWCILAGIDPEAVHAYALSMAAQYRAWREHPHVFQRPRINIPPESWRQGCIP